MESLTRLVTESFARHGFERPVDYRRLRWSRWFRCESHHSLLQVPSKPGVFALAEEVAEFDTNHVGTDAFIRSASSASVEERRFSAASHGKNEAALPAAGRTQDAPRRMLAVTQFFADDDMAFVLDRMLVRQNPMRDRLASGRYFIRYVIIEDASQRRSVYNALNQWIADQSFTDQSVGNSDSAIASHFASSLELTPATEYVSAAQASLFDNAGVARTLPSTSSESATAGVGTTANQIGEANTPTSIPAPTLDSGAATNIHCPLPFPSGF